MLKQLVIIISVFLIFGSLIIAQENPGKQKEETQVKPEVKSEQQVDGQQSASELKIWNTVCPVKGNSVEEDSPTVVYNGKVYGFCCPGCDIKFAKNPEKYIKNLSEDGTKFIGRK